MSRSNRLFFVALVVCPLLLSVPADANAQQQLPPRGQASLSFVVGVPTGEFADNVDNVGFGGDLYLGAVLGTSPFQVGLDLSFLIYGRSTDRVPFSQTVGPRVTVDVVTTNSIIQPHLSLRVQPPTGVVRPYLEGLIGFKYLATNTSVRDDRSNEDVASSTNFDDFAWSGGAGGGVDIRVATQKSERPGQPQRAYHIKLGVQYLLGQEAEYLAEDRLEDTNNDGQLTEDELPIRRSRTDLIQPMVGFTITF